jgi:hypothetical protein
MFQPRAKLEFVRRYCPPPRFSVCVDIDASEEGKTGGPRQQELAKQRQTDMVADAAAVRQEFAKLKIDLKYEIWRLRETFTDLPGHWRGPDIIACDRAAKLCVVTEVEAESSGQPEQKLYKAVGQIVRAISQSNDLWRRAFVIAVAGGEMADHLARMTALERLNVTAVALGPTKSDDRILFGSLAF